MSTPEHVDGDVLRSAGAGKKVIHGSALRLGANLANLVFALATATLLLRHLGVEESGRYVTVMSLVGIALAIVDQGLNVGASKDLTMTARDERRALLANVVGQRLIVAAVAWVCLVTFALVAGYPREMVIGTALAGFGIMLVALGNAMLVPLTVDLRNAGIAIVEMLRSFIVLVGVVLLVAAGAKLDAFLALQILVGLSVLTVVPLLVGRAGVVRPRWDRVRQRALVRTALPVAAALVLGQIYFRLVIVLMSLISSAKQVGYFGGSLRAMEALIALPILVASVALPVMTAAAHGNMARLRYAIEGLSEGAVIAGMLIILVTIRAADPVMRMIGGKEFEPAGNVLRIQVVALLFIALYQIWTVALVALGRQRQLIFTNAVGLIAVGLFAAVLVPPLGAKGGAIASVSADIVLAGLIYWRLHISTGRVTVRRGFLARVAVASLAAGATLLLPMGDIPASIAAAIIFFAVGFAVGMVPKELRDVLSPKGLLRRS
ncbi:MAG TPA: polysaccharide biosynthesis C-terminal domain-containing protein [Solirubrobacterales bacterium]|jgi:O-antigen/teichoic acid export membrane protein|nr:polysaccharide biosynthesis C-terminal domain-containing protein [Solirubrobacterales bacterium]